MYGKTRELLLSLSLSLARALALLSCSLFLLAPFGAQAALYAPGATLDPACAPTDLNCGIITSIGGGTQGQVPYYASSGSAVSATSSITILQNGYVGIATSSPFAPLSVTGNGYFSGSINVGDASTTRSNLGLSYASSADLTNNTNIATWGDSLTAGNEDGTGGTYPRSLQALTGYTIYNGGVGGETSTQIKTRMLAATSKYTWPTIIWAGRNNYTDPTTVKSDIAAMVAALTSSGNNNYIVLGVLNGNYANEYSGQSAYNTIIQLNNDLATTYGSRFIDIRAYLVSLYDSNNAQDVIDHANDIPPSSLRYDNIHLTATGYADVAQKIYQNISLLQPSNKVVGILNLPALFGSPPTIGLVTQGIGLFSQIAIGTTTNTNALDVNGTARIAGGNIELDNDNGNIYLRKSSGAGSAAIQVAGNGNYVQTVGSGVIPRTGTTQDLGISTQKWRGLYLSGTAYVDGSIGIGTSTPFGLFSISALSTNISPLVAISTSTVSATSSAFRIDANGLVGIGSSTPSTQLSVSGSGYFVGGLGVGSLNTTSGAKFTVNGGDILFAQDNGQIKIRKSDGSGSAGLQVSGNGNYVQTVGSGLLPNADNNQTLGLSSQRWSALIVGTGVSSVAGSLGVGTTTPWKTFSVNGTVSFAGLTTDSADTKVLCLTSNNEVVANAGTSCITSSQRFKNTIEPLATSSGLAEVLQLNPVSYQYNSDIGIPGTQVGFIAEQVNQVDPRLVVLDASSTPFTVRYENLTAVLAKAIQEVATITGAFKNNLIAWLGDATNGIEKIFANVIEGNTLRADQQLCVGATCVTESQLKTILQQSSQASSNGGGEAPVTLTQDPAPTDDTSATSTATTTDAASPAQDDTATTDPTSSDATTTNSTTQ